jgi:hypothetical protein
LLLALVDAEEKIQPDTSAFMTSQTMGPRGPRIRHKGLPGHFRARSLSDVHALADEGFVHVRSKNQARITFDLGDEGKKCARLLRAVDGEQPDPVRTDTHPLEWESEVAPVLAAIGRLYGQAQPGVGLRSNILAGELDRATTDASLGLVFEALERAGYVSTTIPTDTAYLPLAFRLEERGLQATASWPSGESAAAAMIAAISARIETTDSAEERGKLQGLLDSLLDVGNNLLGNILANVLTGQLPVSQ